MICIPITSAKMKEALHSIKRSCRSADLIELRMDLIGGKHLAKLMEAIRKESGSVKIIVTCRKKEEAVVAGVVSRPKRAAISTKEKMALLQEAIERGADFIDIELAEGRRAINGLKSLCAQKGNKTKIIISYHNLRETPAPSVLKKIFHQCAGHQPAVVKIVTTAKNMEDNLVMLDLIPYAQKHSQKIIALCMGDQGVVSRAIAPLMGNFLGFASLSREGQSAPGQFTVGEMKRMLGLLRKNQTSPSASTSSWPKSPPRNFILMGNPVEHSLSPLMHNTALQAMEIEEQYSACCVQDIRAAMDGLRAMNIHGASVTIPFKADVMEHLDDIDNDALEIGAVNTIVNRDGHLVGYNTDWLGLILALREAMPVRNKTFVVIGAGGAARAAVYGIIREGGFPIVVNRSPQRAKIISEKFNCPYCSLAEIGKIRADGLINTTPVGMSPQKEQSPLLAGALTGYQYVMDVIYNPLKTKLLLDAEQQGCRTLTGLEMFVHQGAEQLRMWTGKEPPRALMKKIILERLTAK